MHLYKHVLCTDVVKVVISWISCVYADVCVCAECVLCMLRACACCTCAYGRVVRVCACSTRVCCACCAEVVTTWISWFHGFHWFHWFHWFHGFQHVTQYAQTCTYMRVQYPNIPMYIPYIHIYKRSTRTCAHLHVHIIWDILLGQIMDIACLRPSKITIFTASLKLGQVSDQVNLISYGTFTSARARIARVLRARL